MDTENARVTRKEAAEIAGVSERTIHRWREAGLITAEYDPQFRQPATYDREEVLAAGDRWARRLIGMRSLPLPETDIST